MVESAMPELVPLFGFGCGHPEEGALFTSVTDRKVVSVSLGKNQYCSTEVIRIMMILGQSSVLLFIKQPDRRESPVQTTWVWFFFL